MMVSIIVPVYNANLYLRQCVDSVLNQTFQDWELLLLNDGSTDNSAAICDEYSQVDKRIRVFHKMNSGVSDTRNKGLDIATGKYVIFLDSDDYWINNDILAAFVSKSEENDLDIIRANYIEINEQNEIIYDCVNDKLIEQHGNVVTYLQYMKDIVSRNYLTCVFMVKREIRDLFRFNTSSVFMEDAEIYMKMMNLDLRCMYINVDFYAYRKHPTAATVRYNSNKYVDAFNLTRLCYDLASKVEDKEIYGFLIQEGAQNYLDYVKLFLLDKNMLTDISMYFNKLQLKELRLRTIKVSGSLNNGYIKLLILLPFFILRFLLMIKTFTRRLCFS